VLSSGGVAKRVVGCSRSSRCASAGRLEYKHGCFYSALDTCRQQPGRLCFREYSPGHDYSSYFVTCCMSIRFDPTASHPSCLVCAGTGGLWPSPTPSIFSWQKRLLCRPFVSIWDCSLLSGLWSIRECNLRSPYATDLRRPRDVFIRSIYESPCVL
jgi:hypothetical protein